MLVWKKHKLESRLPEEISITSYMQMTPPLWQKVKRNSKALLDFTVPIKLIATTEQGKESRE